MNKDRRDSSLENIEPELDGWRWSLECPSTQAFLISDALSELQDPLSTAVAIYERSSGTHCVQAYYLTKPASEDVSTALKSIGLEAHLLNDAELTPVVKTDWVARSQAGLAPVNAGRYIVHGRHDREKAKCRSLTSIEIDAAEAFGTAHHATTRSCLKALDALLRATTPRHILDLGTGTGILAIAAAKTISDAKICATDNDPIACRTAKRNRDLNRVKRQIDIIEADGFHHPALRRARQFDLIIANILAAPLKALAPEFPRHTKPMGHIILSGILGEQAASICAIYKSHGFTKCRLYKDGEWSTLVMRKNP